MKDKIIKIAEDLEQGNIAEKEARTLLLRLFDVSGSLPTDELIENKAVGRSEQLVCDDYDPEMSFPTGNGKCRNCGRYHDEAN